MHPIFVHLKKGRKGQTLIKSANIKMLSARIFTSVLRLKLFPVKTKKIAEQSINNLGQISSDKDKITPEGKKKQPLEFYRKKLIGLANF